MTSKASNEKIGRVEWWAGGLQVGACEDQAISTIRYVTAIESKKFKKTVGGRSFQKYNVGVCVTQYPLQLPRIAVAPADPYYLGGGP